MKVAELDDDIYDQIKRLSAEGEAYFEREDWKSAIQKYYMALDLVPKPKTDWEASTWLYAALGDCQFMLKDYSKGANAFYDAYNCPDGYSNPFINLRLGQCLYELGDQTKSEEYLMRAYMMEGKDIFDSEAPKYIDHLKSKYTID